MMSSQKYKNRYSVYEFFKLTFSFFMTKLFWHKAKIVSYPVFVRGKKSMVYGKGFSCGYNCRFDLLNKRKKTLIIGQNCQINDFCHIVAIDEVRIGDNFLCASKVFISDCSHGNYAKQEASNPLIPPKERELFHSPVIIGNNVWVGENVVILKGVKIGDGVIIGANSLVNKDIPDYSIAVGSPAKIVKKYNQMSKTWEVIE